MKEEKKIIYFFYPSYITGGAEFLFKRIAESLNRKFEVVIIDIENGWLAKNVQGIKIQYVESSKKITLPDNSILIISSNLLRNIDRYFEKSPAKILSWTIQPNNILPIFPLLKKHRNHHFFKFLFNILLKNEKKKYLEILKEATDKKSLFAMDGESETALENIYHLKYNGYLPVTIKDSSFNYVARKKSTKIDKFIWLGRLDLEFKLHILQKILFDLNAMKSKTHLSIIGTGPGFTYLKNYADSLQNVSVSFLGELFGEELKKEIISCDLGFAMGTSAIEIASLGIPTVLLDFSYQKIDFEYKYRWFFKASDFELGRDIARLKKENIENDLDMRELVFELASSYQEISLKCFEYAKKNHSYSVLEGNLIQAIKGSSLSLENLYSLNITVKPWWEVFRKYYFKFKRQEFK